MKEVIKKLVEAWGPSGFEHHVRVLIRQEVEPYADSIEVDPLGSLICRVGSGGKKVMIAAHMDEIGFVVRYIESKGFLRVQPLGGWDPRMMAAQRVFVHTKGAALNGVLMPGVKPKHLLTPADAAKQLTTDDYFVDTGLTVSQVKKQVQLGDMVTMNRTFQEMGELYTCKAMDDRVAVFVMIEAMKAAKSPTRSRGARR